MTTMATMAAECRMNPLNVDAEGVVVADGDAVEAVVEELDRIGEAMSSPE